VKIDEICLEKVARLLLDENHHLFGSWAGTTKNYFRLSSSSIIIIIIISI